jgi:hypothetical protein
VHFVAKICAFVLTAYSDSPVANRLEMRSKNLAKKGIKYNGIESLVKSWVKRFDEFESRFDQMQMKCNQSLISHWEIEKKKGMIKSFPEFIRKHQNNIFTREQLCDLYYRADGERPSEIDKASKRTKNFLRSNKIEFIKQKDLHEYLSILKKQLVGYVETSANNALS